MAVLYSKGRYYITNGTSSELQWSLRAVRVEGDEREWVLSQARNFKDCGGFSIFDAEF